MSHVGEYQRRFGATNAIVEGLLSDRRING
jgi:hypothetical protein